MVHAKYCAPYPKWPCVRHEINMWCPCCMISLCSRTFYFFLFSPMINVVIILSDVTDVTAWLITSNPNPRVLKIEKMENKFKRKENKKKLSPLFAILILTSSSVNHILYFILNTLARLLSYASPLVWKLNFCSDIISQLYKPAFHSSHLSCNMPYSGAVTIWIFCLPQQRYSYLT